MSVRKDTYSLIKHTRGVIPLVRSDAVNHKDLTEIIQMVEKCLDINTILSRSLAHEMGRWVLIMEVKSRKSSFFGKFFWPWISARVSKGFRYNIEDLKVNRVLLTGLISEAQERLLTIDHYRRNQ